MKIICVDNFDRDFIPQTLVCENVNQYFGELIVRLLNNELSGMESKDYFKLVSDDYKLHPGFEP